MKNTMISFFMIFLLILSSCVSKKQKENTISLSGAFALYPLVIKWSEEYKNEHENIRFNISAGGAGKGMADAMAGAVDLGMFSRHISQEEKNKGVWWVGLCIDAVLPTISASNPYLKEIKKRGFIRKEFEDIYLKGDLKNWNAIFGEEGDVREISVYTRSDACGAAGTWAEYLGAKQEDLKGIGIHGDPGLAEAVSKDPYGIAFNNTIFIYDISTGTKYQGLEVIPLDLNENKVIDTEEDFYDTFEAILEAIATGKYPAPPARELYFVAKTKPEKKATLDFLKWVLTEGQKYVKEAGYVPISEEKAQGYLEKLK